jgi:aldose 1-epimerase
MTMLPTGEQFEIATGTQQVALVEVGGGIRTYRAYGRDVLDGFAADPDVRWSPAAPRSSRGPTGSSTVPTPSTARIIRSR